LTVKVALVWLLVIVQVPALRVAEQAPVTDVQPLGIGDSVAVQVGLPS
jgi:hypothetical protein